MTSILLTLTQSLHLVALAPCVLIILHLILFYPNKLLIILPLAYFSVLSVSLIEHLLPIVGLGGRGSFLLIWIEDFLPALSFLLIIQFLYGALPRRIYWLILCIPLIEVLPFIYINLVSDQVCTQTVCISSEKIYLLNRVITSSFIFMLLTFLLSRTTLSIKHKDVVSGNKYWIIIALIFTNILFVGIDLLLIQESVAYEGYEFANLLVKISFIYLVLSSIFRVFMNSKEAISYHTAPLNSRERQLAKSIIKQFEGEKLYRSLDFNRSQLAESIGVSEHHLSRIVNQFFGKSVSELTNEYRINDAVKRLENTKEPITVIAFDTGFNSITSFNRVFKLRMGMSPSEYRNTRGKDG